MINLADLSTVTVLDTDTLAALLFGEAPDDGGLGRVGIDTETTGLEFPGDRCVSLQLYLPVQQTLAFIPVDKSIHSDAMSLETVVEAMLAVSETHEFIYFNAAFDLRQLYRAGGFQLNIRDASLIATALQLTQQKLKYLVAELGLVPFDQVVSWSALIQTLKDEGRLPADSTDDVSFALVYEADPNRAERYATADAFYTFIVHEAVFQQYATEFTSLEACETVLRWQFDTINRMAQNEAKGWAVDLDQLNTAIELREIELVNEEKAIEDEIRRLMGWAPQQAAQPTVTTVAPQGDLFSLNDDARQRG